MQLKLFRLFFALLNAICPSLAARIAVAVFYAPRRFPSANWEKAALALGKQAKLQFDGERLDGTVWGGGDSTVLLVHGWQGRRGQLAKIAVELSKRGYRVAAFDGPAHGSSEKKRTTLVEFSEAIVSAAQQYGPLHAIVGHSFGAAAVAIALQKGVKADRAVLISCPFSLRNVVSGFAKFVGVPSRSHERMYPIMERLHGCAESKLSFETIGSDLLMPSLLIHDETDQYVRIADGEQVSRTIERGEFLRTSGLGHMRILQDEAVVAKVSSFISDEQQQSSMVA